MHPGCEISACSQVHLWRFQATPVAAAILRPAALPLMMAGRVASCHCFSGARPDSAEPGCQSRAAARLAYAHDRCMRRGHAASRDARVLYLRWVQEAFLPAAADDRHARHVWLPLAATRRPPRRRVAPARGKPRSRRRRFPVARARPSAEPLARVPPADRAEALPEGLRGDPHLDVGVVERRALRRASPAARSCPPSRRWSRG